MTTVHSPDQGYELKSALWRFREHWSGEFADYRMGPFSARARDCDGDFSWWEVKRGEEIVGSGDFSCADHWERALEAAEAKLIELGALHPNAHLTREQRKPGSGL